MISSKSEVTPRLTLWDVSALVSAKTYDEDARGVDEQVLRRLSDSVIGGTVLDAGCGSGIVVRRALEQGALSVVAVDVSAPMLAQLPEDDRLRSVHAALTPQLIEQLARDTETGAFDLVIFKRSLYRVPERALALLGAAFDATSDHGKVVVVHPETGMRRYLSGTSEGVVASAAHALYHALNRTISRALDALGVQEYRTYSLQELLELAVAAAPTAKIDVLPVSTPAFNVVTMSRTAWS